MSERDSVHKEIEKFQEEIKEKNKKLAAHDGRHKHHEEEVKNHILQWHGGPKRPISLSQSQHPENALILAKRLRSDTYIL